MSRTREVAPEAPTDLPPAVILGAYQTGVLGVRSLVRRGVRALCVDSDSDMPGFRSKWGSARLCPNPDRDPDGWVRFMLELGAGFEIAPVLISSADVFVSAIAAHSDALGTRFRVPPGSKIQGLLADKPTQYELAARHGMPMPRTRLARTRDEVAQFAARCRYPALLKPGHFRQWHALRSDHPLLNRKVAIAKDAEQLLGAWQLAAEANPEVILQEIIEGPDAEKRVYLGVYSGDGRRVGSALFRELRCDPVGFGPATVTEPVIDPAVDDICDRFLRSIGYAGICEIEMKRDVRDGAFKLIEANPRLSGSGDAAPYAGVDLCWLHYLDLIGVTFDEVRPRPAGFRHIVLRADARAIASYRRAGLATWRDILRSYRPPLAFYDLDAGDLRYSAETIALAVRSVFRGMLGRPD